MSPRRRRAVRIVRALRKGGVVVAVLAVVASALAWIVPLPRALVARPSVAVMDARGAPLHVFLSEDEKWRLPVRVDDVDPRFLDALFAYEDARFWWHPGVDPIAVARAAISNARAGRVVSGGSTITMQLARLVEPRPRTLGAKLIEAVRAVQIEARLDKREILELYLSRAPFGRNLEGIETASWSLFAHSARALSSDEIAVLLALPQKPNERAPSAAHTEVLRTARREVAQRLVEQGAWSDVERGEVERAPVPSSVTPLPRRAPHAAVWLRAQDPDADVIHTTLDARAQRLAEQAFASERERAERDGISAGAVVVVEHSTGAVRALVGGYDFLAETDGAQIPAFATPRATGSTLKPFIYAEAIDEGRALPDTLVEDVPRVYGAYAPRNFDGGFDGVVRLEDALSRSLNLPFVDLLHAIGTERFLGTLRQMGVRSLVEEPGHYGLSVAAGSLEMTPLELAGMFAMLANDGVATDVHVRARAAAHVDGDDDVDGGVGAAGRRITSPGAAWLTRRALSLRDRPDFPTRGRAAHELRAIHWKTGTSFHHRDAWAAGSGARYTVVVWQGNMDRRPSVHLVGAEAAAPILFDVLESLGSRDDPVVDAEEPADLARVEVCALSGRLPGPACPHTKMTLARTQKVPTERCAFHDHVEVDVATGLRVLPGCRAGKGTRMDVVTLWPTAVRRFLNARMRALPKAPSLHAACASDDAPPPRIVSPAAGISLLLVPGMDADRQEVPLEAAGAGTLSWFVDGVHIGDAPADERLWWTPAAGTHAVVAMDEHGRRARVALEVLAPEAMGH